MVAIHPTRGYAFTSALEGKDLPHGGSPPNVISYHHSYQLG